MKIVDIFKGLFNPKNKESKKSQTTYYLGNNPITNAGMALTFEEFTSLSYMMKGIQIIANDIAKVNFSIQQFKKDKGQWSEMVTSKLDFLLNRSPNKTLTGFEFKKLLVWNLFLYSKAPIYVHYERGPNDSFILTELIPIFPDWCEKVWDNNVGKYKYTVSQTPTQENEWGSITNKKNDIVLEDWQVIWIDLELIQGVSDVTFRNLFKGSLSKLKENETALINAIKNDTGLSMFIKVPDLTSEEQRKRLQESLNGMIASQKKHGSIVFVGDSKWEIQNNEKVIKSNIDYAARNAVGREAASMLNMPPSKLGIEDSNKYNTFIERQKAYVDEALRPILINISTKLTNFFFPNLPNKQITIKSLDLLSLDINSLQAFASSAINNGYATPNEIRSLIGFNPHEDGDVLMANGSLQDIGLTRSKLQIEVEKLEKDLKEPAKDEENTNIPQEEETPVKTDENQEDKPANEEEESPNEDSSEESNDEIKEENNKEKE